MSSPSLCLRIAVALRHMSLAAIGVAVAAQWPPSAPQSGSGQESGGGQGQGGAGSTQGGSGGDIQQWPPSVTPGYQTPWVPAPGSQNASGAGSSQFPGVQQSSPEFRGFPSVTNRQGFGAYPNYPGLAPSAKIDPQAVPPVGPLRPAGLWPSWLTLGRSDDSVRVRPDRALLVRNAERVWYRPAGEPVYVPLPFHDNVREVEAGAAVQVRTHTGEATLVFHDGATLRATGSLSVEVRILADAVAELDLHNVHRAWLDAKARPVHLRLPDASVLEVAGALVYLARDGERLTVCSYGPAGATLRSPLGTVEVPRTRQVQTLMSPLPDGWVSTVLDVDGTVRARAEGRRVAVEGGNEGGSLEWSGARVRLSPNQRATVDALAGEVFPEYRKAGPLPTTPAAR
ncbi:MAG: hypothetical protein R3F56_18460 [Planctomycetota bacterium]